MKVGKIVNCEKHPDADALYLETIECGEEKPRQVISGLVKHIPLDEMQNRMVILLCNLKPAKMRGIVSEAMVMCASTPEKVRLYYLKFDKEMDYYIWPMGHLRSSMAIP